MYYYWSIDYPNFDGHVDEVPLPGAAGFPARCSDVVLLRLPREVEESRAAAGGRRGEAVTSDGPRIIRGSR
jgi:hypothetical protein